MESWPPRIVIAAPQGRSGKTTLAIGLCAAYAQSGLAIQPFKKGPDYIDPSWLTVASNRICRNLDLTLMSEDVIRSSFQRVCKNVDMAIVEGAMGLFDSIRPHDISGSTAHLARLLGAPVVLIINTNRMTTSVAALVNGFKDFDRELTISGVVFNNVAGSRHEKKLITAVEYYCGIPVLGILPKRNNMRVYERHMGLVPYQESLQDVIIENIAQITKQNIDLDQVMAIARSAEPRNWMSASAYTKRQPSVKVGVVYDQIFNFYYPENLEALEHAGARIFYIDSINDHMLPDIDGLYIGGGFPELFLDRLEMNSSLRAEIKRGVDSGLPVYAECGGLMYLCEGIKFKGKRHQMVGVLPLEVDVFEKPLGHGYVEVEVSSENPLLPAGLKFWGHEFHYSKVTGVDEFTCIYNIKHGYGINGKQDGVHYKNVIASYTHVHALTLPEWAVNFIALLTKERARKLSVI